MLELALSIEEAATSKPSDAIGDKLELLAAKLIDEALATNEDPEKNIGFTARVDIFKAISIYHLGKLKVDNKTAEKEDNPTDFGSAKRRIAAAAANKGAA